MKPKPFFRSTFLLPIVLCLLPILAQGQKEWHNALDIGLSGQAWSELEHPYDRLPAKAKDVVRPQYGGWVQIQPVCRCILKLIQGKFGRNGQCDMITACGT